jgi:uncharacterized membrane protein
MNEKRHHMKFPSSNLDRAFFIGLCVKTVDGLLGLVLGVVLLFVTPLQLNLLAQSITRHFSDQDRDDFLYHSFAHFITHLTGGSIRFAALYLLFDSLLKLVLIFEIAHRRYWAYIALIVVLSGLVAYQSYRVIYTHSLLLTLLTLFDLVVIYLSAQEYLRHQKAKQVPAL